MHAPAPAQELTNEQIVADLTHLLGRDQVIHSLIERTAMAGDASIYRLVPRVVVRPRNTDDVESLLAYCRTRGLYVTFRAAGTSLSGQAVTDGILVDVSRHFKGIRILEDGARVAAEPGVIAAHVNSYLARHKAKIGPDPASINACMMGGVAANNASGMCCGVEYNSYHTMASMRLLLADGWSADTAEPGVDERFASERPAIYSGLVALRDQIRRNPEHVERIRRKFAIKNTTGYAINAFIDFERPIDILAHLLIGSEGTLGFISEITLSTLPDRPHKATAMAYFRNLVDAGRAIFPLGDAGAAVLEIMDRNSMMSVADEMNYPFTPEGNCAALLIEFQEDDAHALEQRLEKANSILATYDLLEPVEFSKDPTVQAHYWHMRKGLYPSVGAMREIGTAVIIEDVCVEPRYLADAITDLQAMFVRHQFEDSIIFGHAKNGNVHFVICTDFADHQQVERYSALMEELTDTIVRKYDGSLKAEHGTGRNIAPFVQREWGKELTDVMWSVKRLLDPQFVLNPGVVLNDNPRAHLEDLKVMPKVSGVVDKCIECGFCEPRCPSREVTITPRQRIVVLREVARLKALGDRESRATADELLEAYDYWGDRTCATDGMCATACPVKINTGELIKDLRAEQHPAWSRSIATSMARSFGLVAWGARMGLTATHIAGPVSLGLARLGARIANIVTQGATPALPHSIPVPYPAPPLPRTGASQSGVWARGVQRNGAATHEVVYFPTCLTRSLGRLPQEPADKGLAEALIQVLEACGWTVTIPDHIGSLCCGQPFFSKGFNEAGAVAVERTIRSLFTATNGGELPVVCDTSPCSGQFQQVAARLSTEVRAMWEKIKIIDFPTFMARSVLPSRAHWPKLKRHAVLHPTCTLMKMGGLVDLRKVADTFAEKVTIPVQAECCGFAGDRGFLHPELTLGATRHESEDITTARAEASTSGLSTTCYSTCRTCEIGMTAGTDSTYTSIVHLCYDALCTQGDEH